MCGIAGILRLDREADSRIPHHLDVMGKLIEHRGPDGSGTWVNKSMGFVHKRLSIIDLEHGQQPMSDSIGNTVCFNGEIYNYIELRELLRDSYSFKTSSDTEVILAAYAKWGRDCVDHFKGMYAFAIWDEKKKELFCSRDHFGIKPFYYAQINNVFYFASEAKALLPFLDNIETDEDALKDYLSLQLYLDGKTLFKGIKELPPAHNLTITNNKIEIKKYWEVYYSQDFNHSRSYFEEKLAELVKNSVDLHTRADVEIGSYISGGIDSSIVGSLASKLSADKNIIGFTGKFELGDLYDESQYARDLCQKAGFDLHEKSITSNDFLNNIEKTIYHLDYPVAGPGSFSQYMISDFASEKRKVVLGGQGGDEIFGGYTRYLIAYFEQCVKGAVEGTLNDGNFIVDYQSIIPNLVTLKNYKPMMKQFFSKGMFDPLDDRYFHLINRAPGLGDEIRFENFTSNYSTENSFKKVFNGENVGKESYFDKMTHFDFKTLLPGLLQVEDRMSMAHGLESRVPFLEKDIVEFAATMPSDIKFKDGTLKMILTGALGEELPDSILNRTDKMGFPTPFNMWAKSEARSLIMDTFNSTLSKERKYINNSIVLKDLENQNGFGRKLWGLFSLELWQKQFHDKQAYYKGLLN